MSVPEVPHMSDHMSVHPRVRHARLAMVPVSLDLARQLAMFGQIVRRTPDNKDSLIR